MKALTFFLLLIETVLMPLAVFSQRPNFVVIVLDDLNPVSLPPVGPSFLNYPSIQRIYQEGLQVRNAYCLMPLCNPSRYSMLTSTYPHVHGAIDNATLPRPDLPTFYSIAASHGYHNAYVGKYSNMERKNIPGLAKTLTIANIDQDNAYMWYNNVKKLYPGNITVTIDDTAKAWLATIDTPFILGVGHIGTHLPIAVVNAYVNDYNGKGSLPDNYSPYSHDFPSFLYSDSSKVATDSDRVKSVKEESYEILSEINRGVENIFSVLESRGILNNTMIILTNDNGFLYGEHHMWSKGDAREPASSLPLFIRYPEWFAPGTVVSGNMIGLHDIGPTILDAAGINTAPFNFQGRSINYLMQPGHERTAIYLEHIRTDSSDGSDSQYPSWRAVRTPGFKYIKHHCESQVEELFNLIADPEENVNVINDPAYADTLRGLRALLDSLAVATMDTLSSDTVYLPCTLIECDPHTFYFDADGDNFGNPSVTTFQCTAPPNYVSNGNDCDDASAIIYPGASDLCNGIDDNCNGSIDENAIIASISPGGSVAICKGTKLMLSANNNSGISYQWVKNNVEISGATKQTYTASEEGQYKVNESNSFGCSSASAVTTISTISNPPATITPLGSLDICNTGSVILQANGKNGLIYQWQKHASNIAGATNKNYTAVSSGTYKVIVTKNNGCSKTSSGTKVTNSCRENSSINSSNNIELSIFPNLTTGKFIVELTEEDVTATTATIEVYSAIGQRIYNEIVPMNEGNLHREVQLQNGTPEGIYFVKVIANGKVYSGQIIYQK